MYIKYILPSGVQHWPSHVQGETAFEVVAPSKGTKASGERIETRRGKVWSGNGEAWSGNREAWSGNGEAWSGMEKGMATVDDRKQQTRELKNNKKHNQRKKM